ncbi:MAG: bis(5'-nucleosyl)-tetraphosphatase (symmetrical) [Gammaproteobacteria bacterium RIFCSPHIGHO2_02_FULL_42_13]|nr:MAG: bis(5'-nucleosyl)-tetraphosphatase (symmetrical) [Gammaproteobacteria bacterium RIFCSPHIGHO2_02_FULL_42_13]OGT69227.1 MAG: bis(5'-nucleosyl)-tetraphosphatase (symmetrical) [Gammaproteobacteria bacterium RIFCSPLOWO2_02_FULL_42_9]
MSVYAIGDIQGCYDELRLLLDRIQFDPAQDQLWFVGDLVNRGSKSLETLRFIKNLKEQAIITLGNHDLHLLAVANGARKLERHDTVSDILNAPDRDELLHWLRHQKFLYENDQFIMVHAGIYPFWTIAEAKQYAQEIETILHGDNYIELLSDNYGPNKWDNNLKGLDRYRFIVSAFTAMRYCDKYGRLDVNEKGSPGSQSKDLFPWFELSKIKNKKIIFGHWAALRASGMLDGPIFYSIDTGCFWGGVLTAFRLEDHRRFSVTKSNG